MAREVLSLWTEAPGAEGACGRDAELSVLLREREEARAGERARFVFVRGSAGVGKSHLFRTLRQSLAARGVPVFAGESPREAKRPFGLFASLLTELIDFLGHSGTPAEKLAAASRAIAPVLGHGSSSPAEERRLTLFDGACELFNLVGRSHPVFLFEDLDAADRASLELFRYLAAVTTAPEARSGGLFVASFRDDAPLAAPLSEVLAKVSARTVSLGGLDLDGIRAYLSRRELAERLLEATGGHPDALEELLHRPAGKPVELFLRRAERLPESQRAVLGVLAASPEALGQDAVAAALERMGVAFGAAAELDALVRAHLVTVKVLAGRPAYRFTREAERLAFVQALSPERRRELARALGEALLGSGDAVSASRLLLEVDPAGAGAAAAISAADQLFERGAHEDALELYQRALPHLERGAAGVRVLRRMSEIAAAMGDFRKALLHLLRTRRFAPRSPAARAELADRAARLLLRLGRLRLAEAMVRIAAEEPATSASAVVSRAELELLRGRPEQAVAVGESALGGLSADPERQIVVRNVMGKAFLLKGELDRAEAAFAENYEQSQAGGFKHHAAMATLNRGVAALKAGDRERAIRFFQAGANGHRPTGALALANLGSLYAESGDFELALDHLSRALQAYSRFAGSREVAHIASNLARLNHFLGDVERAIELSEHALERAREIGERYLAGSALLNLGAALIDRRELHEAQRLLEEARASFEKVGNDGYAALAAALKARAHLLAGERAQASTELSRRAVEKAGGLPAAVVEVELTRAELCLALGDLHGAGRAAARARDSLLSRPDLEGPYRVYFLMGRLRLAANDAAGAQAEMARAARLLDELTQRVPAPRRNQFLSIPRRSEVLAALEPELRLPKLTQAAAGPAERFAHGLVGRSAALGKITRQLEPIGRSNATVLIRGESGTGKELLAEALHNLSPRKGMPLVKVNCAAMVEELLLSELFGHEKGAFTGAIRERKGRFELADGGTLFLDEIGDISPKCQVALLRVLQEREFERVGGTKTLKVDVRVICATNRDLESLIAQGRFRQDLYYRLKGVMLELPPLRERPEDVPVLASHLLERIARERSEAPKQLAQEALELLARHGWPGNVRELENVLASAAIFADGGLITPEAFGHIAELAALTRGEAPRPIAAPPAPLEPVRAAPIERPPSEPEGPLETARAGPVDFYQLVRARGVSLKDLRHEVEVQCIRKALAEANGNISEAARLLKMKRSRLSQIVNSEPELKGVAHGD